MDDDGTKGEIGKAYTLFCGVCLEGGDHYLVNARTMAGAADAARAAGYKLLHISGWTCPECVEKGRAAATRPK